MAEHKPNAKAAIKRLRGELAKERQRDDPHREAKQLGGRLGEKWALETASPSQLARLRGGRTTTPPAPPAHGR